MSAFSQACLRTSEIGVSMIFASLCETYGIDSVAVRRMPVSVRNTSSAKGAQHHSRISAALLMTSGAPGSRRIAFTLAAAQNVSNMVLSNSPAELCSIFFLRISILLLTNFMVRVSLLQASNNPLEGKHPPAVHGSVPQKELV